MVSPSVSLKMFNTNVSLSTTEAIALHLPLICLICRLYAVESTYTKATATASRCIRHLADTSLCSRSRDLAEVVHDVTISVSDIVKLG